MPVHRTTATASSAFFGEEGAISGTTWFSRATTYVCSQTWCMEFFRSLAVGWPFDPWQKQKGKTGWSHSSHLILVISPVVNLSAIQLGEMQCTWSAWMEQEKIHSVLISINIDPANGNQRTKINYINGVNQDKKIPKSNLVLIELILPMSSKDVEKDNRLFVGKVGGHCCLLLWLPRATEVGNYFWRPSMWL